ncbi:hypothetical protein MAM1_0517c10813 [Mucor ambiguus]|uniref:Uncharacterized protein n=1 Tax=Mucor ambiguus TaxID=91626 RepID=A0A0C9MV18_9FUNG|nr:hypothetical protein MAM1_0517c10813 [Mucor ambiguus]
MSSMPTQNIVPKRRLIVRHPDEEESFFRTSISLGIWRRASHVEATLSKKQKLTAVEIGGALNTQFYHYILAEIAASTNTQDTFDRL